MRLLVTLGILIIVLVGIIGYLLFVKNTQNSTIIICFITLLLVLCICSGFIAGVSFYRKHKEENKGIAVTLLVVGILGGLLCLFALIVFTLSWYPY